MPNHISILKPSRTTVVVNGEKVVTSASRVKLHGAVVGFVFKSSDGHAWNDSDNNESPCWYDDRAASVAALVKHAQPSRIEVIVRLISQKRGASVDEIADALLDEYPTLSKRWGHAPATREQYVTFARSAIQHLRRGTNFAVAKETEGRVERGDDGRYRYTR